MSFELNSTSKGFRIRLVEDLVFWALNTKYNLSATRASPLRFAAQAAAVRNEVPALESIGLEGEIMNGRFFTWKEVAAQFDEQARLNHDLEAKRRQYNVDKR